MVSPICHRILPKTDGNLIELARAGMVLYPGRMKCLLPGGLLVAVEGIDGAGKTSISALLAQWCGERGLACMVSKEPTGLKWGQELRRSAKEGRADLARELELFELDRRDHIERAIAPALAKGAIVILDRYFWSTAAYQGARGADVNAIIENHATFAPTPDLVLVLDLDVDGGLTRIRQRGDRPNTFEGKASLTAARNIFIQLAGKYAYGTIIDAGGHMDDSFSNCLAAFQRAFVEKLAASGPLHPEMVNVVLEFFGAARLAHAYPQGTPPYVAAIAKGA